MKHPLFLLLLALAMTTAVYWPGLDGVFMLDDDANLAPVWRWLDGQLGWMQVVFENESGPLGRPISMFSFTLNALVAGQSAWAFKLVNLVIHLMTGAAIYLLLARLLAQDHLAGNRARWVAVAVAAIWLLHPFQVSTVLYVVQRMAMLAALFTVLALWAYVRGRLALDAGNARKGAVWLFSAVPAFTLLAAFSKETGLLVPLFCAVIEWSCFAPARGTRRPGLVRGFVATFMALPVAAAALFLLFNPDFFLAGYENRSFSFSERVLTQPRILFDYLGSLLLPVGQTFSLYRDDYTLSQGLLAPMTTLWAMLGWVGIIASAVALRRRLPGYSAGIGLFIAGHAMESTIFPLLIYFEHRNYLPSVGLFLAVASVLVYGSSAVRVRMDRPGLVFGGALIGLLLAISFSTLSRALAWTSPIYLLEQSVARYPDSRFGRMELAALIMNSPFPDHEAAASHYRHLQGLPRPSTRMIGHLGEIAVSCHTWGRADTGQLDQAFSHQPEAVEAVLIKSVEALVSILMRTDCEGISTIDFARKLVKMSDENPRPESSLGVWRMRFRAAQLFASGGLDEPALEQAEEAWASGNADLPVGMMIAGLRIRLEQYTKAEVMLDALEPRIPKGDLHGRALLQEYRSAIEEQRNRTILHGVLEL